ncbi:MAG: hypothetical protein ABTQ31_12390 [Rhizobiaceae bacterium]
MRKVLLALMLVALGAAAALLAQRGMSDLDLSRYVVIPHFDDKAAEHERNAFDAELDKAGIRGCANVFGALGDVMTQGARYAASTAWDRQGRYISSSVALDFPAGTGSIKAAGVVFAASGRDGRCSGNFVRVFPVPADCGTFQQANLQDAKRRDDLAGLAVYDMPNGWSVTLLPTPAACVVVATASVSRG